MPLFALTLFLAAATEAVPGTGTGELGTLQRGLYRCEAPGDAAGPAGLAREQEDFEVLSSSRYKAHEGRGIYLRKGDLVTVTSGPRKGTQYRLVTEQYLLKLGDPEGLRCYWRGRVYD